MRKIQTILSLLLLVSIIFVVDMMFGNPLKETFSNQVGLPGVINGVGSTLTYKPTVRTNTLNGNMIYSGNSFLAATPPHSRMESDDQPLFFGFSN